MERSSGWIAGGLFMSFSLALLAFVSMSGSADTPVATPSTVPAESPAVAAARDWLALVDKSDWHASWEATGLDRTSVVEGESVSVRVALGVRRDIKKQKIVKVIHQH